MEAVRLAAMTKMNHHDPLLFHCTLTMIVYLFDLVLLHVRLVCLMSLPAGVAIRSRSFEPHGGIHVQPP